MMLPPSPRLRTTSPNTWPLTSRTRCPGTFSVVTTSMCCPSACGAAKSSATRRASNATLRWMVTIDDVRAVVKDLPRSYEAYVHGRVKFRVGRIVYLDFSRDQTIMGFAFPRDWRPVLISSDPTKFMLPIPSELRWNWARVRLEAIDHQEMADLVLDAWAFVVPKSVAATHFAQARRVTTNPSRS